jgi:hypothetical protein
MGKVALKLNGKPLDLHPLTPTAQRVLDFLRKSPADEVFTSKELERRIGCAAGYVKGSMTSIPALQPFTLKVRNERYWGSSAAIAELRRQTQ